MNRLKTLIRMGQSERQFRESIADFLNGEIRMAIQYLSETLEDTDSPENALLLSDNEVVRVMQRVLSKLEIDVIDVVEEVLAKEQESTRESEERDS